MTRKRLHALTTWIAGLAFLFGMFAPSLSHAFLRAAPRVVEFPVCSAAGHAPVLASIDADREAVQHCPYCTDQHYAPALPVRSGGACVFVGAPHRPVLFHTAPAPLFHPAAPLSRAPPAVS